MNQPNHSPVNTTPIDPETAKAAIVMREAAAAGHWVVLSPDGRAWIGERLTTVASQALVDTNDPEALAIVAEMQQGRGT